MNQKKTKESTSSEDGALDLNKESHRDYLSSLRRSLSQDVKTSDTEANETDRVLSNQLILITTVLITANIVFLGNKEILYSLTTIQRVLVLCGLGLLMISLGFGIRYYQEIRKFHMDRGDLRQEIIDATFEMKTGTYFSEILQKYILIQSGHNSHIEDKFLKYQIRCLYSALIAYFILIMALVFDFSFIFNAANPCLK